MRGLRIHETRRARTLRADATSAEAKLWKKLRNRQLAGHKFARQVPIGPCFGDFVCREAKLIVEVDGATHSTDEELARDARRTIYLEAEGYRLVRVNNVDVFESVDGVVELILAELSKATSA